jgi:hypothetical protein
VTREAQRRTVHDSVPRGARHSGTQQTAVYRCVTQQGWGTYLAGRRKARQALGAGQLDGGGPQGVWEGPLVLLTGICGALVGRWVSHPVGEALCGGRGA